MVDRVGRVGGQEPETALGRQQEPAFAIGRRKASATPRPYVLRGLLYCCVCTRRMEGGWNNGRPHYRCKFPTEYAVADKIDHPRTVYVREDQILDELDPWLCRIFTPANSSADGRDLARCPERRGRTRRHRYSQVDHRRLRPPDGSLPDDSGRGWRPPEIGKWMAETRAERLKAEGWLRAITRKREISEREIAEMITRLAEMTKVIKKADPADRNDLYTQMGLHLVYDPLERGRS